MPRAINFLALGLAPGFDSLSLVPSNPRVVVDEIMDGPDVEPSEHAKALAGLGRINAFSLAARQMARPIIRMAHRLKIKRLSLLDVACGGGDVSIGIATAACRQGIEIDLTLLDRSETALKLASAAASRAGITAGTVQADLLNDRSLERFDVITCSLFLHHLREPEQVIHLLAQMRCRARRQVVISDLRRSRSGLGGAWIGSRILSRSPIVHFDAPASVRAAWTVEELTDFAATAGMTGATVEGCWPWRMLLNWEAVGDTL